MFTFGRWTAFLVGPTSRVDNERAPVLPSENMPGHCGVYRGNCEINPTRRNEGSRCMEKTDEQLILSLLGTDAELKRHYDEHLDLERQIGSLQQKVYLTPDEEFEKKRLQKLKLAGKDRIMEILSRYRGH